MSHLLDRPIWASLTTRQAHLALGEGPARRIGPDYGLFVAAADRSPASLQAVAELVRVHGEAVMVEAEPPPAIPGVTLAPPAELWQMVADDPQFVTPGFEVTPLTDQDGPQMLALATLTRPGPFVARTHKLGDFVGVKREGALVAMAGERLMPAGYTEVSAICTHPDHRGRGYAAGLASVVARRIVERGETPFLHSYAHNTGAIRLYEALGYRLRRRMAMSVLTPA